jgi:hypothetical protein
MAVYQGKYPVLSFSTGTKIAIRPGSYTKFNASVLSGIRVTKEVTGLTILQEYILGNRQYKEFIGFPYNQDNVVQGGTGQIKTPRQEPLEITWKTALFDN